MGLGDHRPGSGHLPKGAPIVEPGRLRGLHHGEPLPGEPFEAGFGGLSVLTKLPLPCDLVAEPGTVLFVLDEDTLLGALEQRGRLARTALRAMARSVLAVRRGEGQLLPSAVTMPRSLESRTLDLVSRMTALRSAVGMPTVNAMVLTSLARAARVETLPPGRSLWPNPTAPADLVIVLEGGLDGHPDDEQGPRAGRGALYGLMESVASLPRDTPVLTTVQSTAMVISYAEIQEAIDDDDRICLGLMRLAAGELWNAFWRRYPLLDEGVHARSSSAPSQETAPTRPLRNASTRSK